MKLVDRLFSRSDLARARAKVQEVAEERVNARRALDQIERDAARALADAIRLEEEDFRIKFEKRLVIRSAFLPSLAPAGASPTPFDPWEFTRRLKGKPTVKPVQPYPIRALYVEHRAAA